MSRLVGSGTSFYGDGLEVAKSGSSGDESASAIPVQCAVG